MLSVIHYELKLIVMFFSHYLSLCKINFISSETNSYKSCFKNKRTVPESFLHFFWRSEKNVVILQPKKYNLYTLYIYNIWN